MKILRCLAMGLALLGPAGRAASFSPLSYRRADVAPAKTSIVVGSVSLTLDPLLRRGDSYVSRYSARVFPFLFWSEAGRFRIDVPDASLRKLSEGARIDFAGTAVRDDGKVRTVTGTATPSGPASGTIKVRIFVTRHIVLVFDSTYRLPAASSGETLR